MKRFNLVMLVDTAGESMLMCQRRKPPYEGLMNLVGGKVAPDEDGLHAAYRELREETGVTAADVTLSPLITLTYPGGGAGLTAYELQVYAGRLCREVAVSGDENPLKWVPLTENFFDMERFAGEGNIGHIVHTVMRYRRDCLQVKEKAITLAPLAADDMPIIAFYHGCLPEELQLMLCGSQMRRYEGRYYEQLVIRAGSCIVGLASLCDRGDGCFSEGLQVFTPFRRCGFGHAAIDALAQRARQLGAISMTAQVRTDNAGSLRLHERAGFQVTQTHVNRRGREVNEMEKKLTTGVRHEMRLRPKPFQAIASGNKKYELRLHDEKRRAIRVGDEILFTCTEDDRSVLTRVTGLYPFADFAALYRTLPLTECGYTPANVHRADPKDMEAYYPPEEQAQHGVLAIGIERVRLPLGLLAGPYTVRELTHADIPEMLRVAEGNPLYYRHMGILPDEINLASTLTALPPRTTLADKHFFGWFEGERLVALMDLIWHYPKADMAFIGWFMVDAACQRRCLGRGMVEDVLEMLRDAGVREVRLGRVEGNPQSERFWQVCGFCDNDLSYNTDGYRVIVMQMLLA